MTGTLDLAGIRARAEAARQLETWSLSSEVYRDYALGMDPPTTLALVDEVERLRLELEQSRFLQAEAERDRDRMTGHHIDMRKDVARSRGRAGIAEAEAAKLRARVAELETSR